MVRFAQVDMPGNPVRAGLVARAGDWRCSSPPRSWAYWLAFDAPDDEVAATERLRHATILEQMGI